MSYPHYDLVQRAHQELIAEGLIGPRTNQDAVEQDKGLLTRRAAYYAFTMRDPTHGLLAKTSGNNSLGYSVDWILSNRDGTGWDIATDDGVNALPLNGGPEAPDAARIPDWRPPTAELAGLREPEPEPEPTPDDDVAERLAELEAAVDHQSQILAEQTAAIERLRTQGYHGECKLGLTMHFGMFPAEAAMAGASVQEAAALPLPEIVGLATLENALERAAQARDKGRLVILVVG